MNDLYFIDYQPKVMLVDTLGMRPDCELAHRRLCDYIWAMGEAPPDDAATLREIARVPPENWVRVRGELMLKGWHVKEGRFTHKGTVNTGERCRQVHANRVASSRAANAVRWNKNGVSSDSERTPQSIPKRTPTGTPSAVRRLSYLQSQSPLSYKAYKGLTRDQKELSQRLEKALGIQWLNDAGKWVNRIKSNPDKAGRVIAETESAMREERIKATPAQYAEQIWKEFA